VEEYFTTCIWMNDNYGWSITMDEKDGWKLKLINNKGQKTKMDEKLKWMNITYLQLMVMCYVNSTSSQPRSLCQLKHYYSSPRSMFPLRIETIWGHTSLIPFHIVFLFEFSLSNLLRLISFLPFEEENCILSPIST
jgi:hypothetical protein